MGLQRKQQYWNTTVKIFWIHLICDIVIYVLCINIPYKENGITLSQNIFRYLQYL